MAGIAITLGLILLIIPGLALITIWCLIIPAIVLERTGTLAAFGRSLQLVRGYFWNVFGTLVLVWLILIAVGIVLGAIFSFMPHLLGQLPRAPSSAGLLVAPFIAVVLTSMYFRLVAAPAGGPVNAGGPYGTQNPYGSATPGTFGGPPPGQQFGGGFPPAGPCRTAVSPLRRRRARQTRRVSADILITHTPAAPAGPPLAGAAGVLSGPASPGCPGCAAGWDSPRLAG